MATEEASRRRRLGLRTAVALPTVVAILSLATGITNISVGVTISGPLGGIVPEAIQEAAGFTGTLTGFVLLLAARSLQRRFRVGWYLTMFLLPITALQGLIQASIYSLPLVVLSLVALPTLAVNYRRFDRSVTLSSAQIAAIIALSGTLAYGTLGSYTLREEYVAIDTLTDAFYYTVVTASTVGYGDMTPQSQQARLFGLSVVVLGTASFAVALGSVLGPAIEARLARTLGTMTDSDYDLLEDHVVILGIGDLTESLLEELGDRSEFVVVTDDQDQASDFQRRNVNVVVGDPSDEGPLSSAGIEQAGTVIVATESDAADALAILTARQLNPDARIVAAATSRENIEKLRHAGADIVFSPAAIGGHLLGQSALGNRDVEQFLDGTRDE